MALRPVGYYYSSASVWSSAQSNAVISRRDCGFPAFGVDLSITSSGYPVITSQHTIDILYPPVKWTGATNETDYFLSYWESGSWNHKFFSEKTNIAERVGRSGCYGIYDLDNDYHFYIAVNGIPKYRMKPSSTYSSAFCSPSTVGSAAVYMVDDGISHLDTTTYLTISGSGGDGIGHISLRSTAVFGLSETIEDVFVDAVVEPSLDAAHSVHIYVASGSSIDSSGAVTLSTADIDNYYCYRYSLGTTNPFTSSRWTIDDINSLIFGIRNVGSPSIKLGKMILGVRYNNAFDREWNASDVIEIVSKDHGETWSTPTYLSKNSYIGVPIISGDFSKNRENPTLVWCAGNDVFISKVDPYGYLREDALDFRIYYGTAEINCAIDYTNLDSSLVYFRLQSTVDANTIAGDKDYYVYYGNRDETSNPLRTPSDVFLYFNNFESLVYGNTADSLSSEFSILTGTSNIVSYVSPPEHANKVYSGNVSLRATADASFELTLPDVYSNVKIDVNVWPAGQKSDTIFINAVDSADNEVGIGDIYDSTADIRYGAYYYDSAWHLASGYPSYRVTRADNWHEFSLNIGSDGFTPEYNSSALCYNYGEITDVEKIRFTASSEAFFDNIRVYRNYIVTSTASYSSAAVGERAFATYGGNAHLHPDSDSSPAIDGSNDAYLDIPLQEQITQLDFIIRTNIAIDEEEVGTPTPGQTHYYKLWVCDAPSYDSTNILSSTYFTLTHVDTSWTNLETSFSIKYLPPGPKSFKIDCYDTDYEPAISISTDVQHLITYYGDDQNPVITVGERETRGLIALGGVIGAGREIFYGTYGVYGYELNKSGNLRFSAAESTSESANLRFVSENYSSAAANLRFVSQSSANSVNVIRFIAQNNASSYSNIRFTGTNSLSTVGSLRFTGSSSSNKSGNLRFTSLSVANNSGHFRFISQNELESSNNIRFVAANSNSESGSLRFVGTYTDNKVANIRFCGQSSEYGTSNIRFVCENQDSSTGNLRFTSYNIDNKSGNIRFSGAESQSASSSIRFVSYNIENTLACLRFVGQSSANSVGNFRFISESTNNSPQNLRFVGYSTNNKSGNIRFISAVSANSANNLRFSGIFSDNQTGNLRFVSYNEFSTSNGLRFVASSINSTVANIRFVGTHTTSSANNLRFCSENSSIKIANIRFLSEYSYSDFGSLRFTGYNTYNKSGNIRFSGAEAQDKISHIRFIASSTSNSKGNLRFISSNSETAIGNIRFIAESAPGSTGSYKAGNIRFTGYDIDSIIAGLRFSGAVSSYSAGHLRFIAAGTHSGSNSLRFICSQSLVAVGLIRFSCAVSSSSTGNIRFIASSSISDIGNIRFISGISYNKYGNIRFVSSNDATLAGQLRFVSSNINSSVGNIRFASGYLFGSSGNIRFNASSSDSNTGSIRYLCDLGGYSESVNLRFIAQNTSDLSANLRFCGSQVFSNKGNIFFIAETTANNTFALNFTSELPYYKVANIKFIGGDSLSKSGHIRYVTGGGIYNTTGNIRFVGNISGGYIVDYDIQGVIDSVETKSQINKAKDKTSIEDYSIRGTIERYKSSPSIGNT